MFDVNKNINLGWDNAYKMGNIKYLLKIFYKTKKKTKKVF